MTYIKDKRIERFIELVTMQVHTQAEAQHIEEELREHIQCLVEDYVEGGYGPDEAIGKALFQMGDPSEIGFSFTDYDLMKKRRYMLWGFKVLSVLSMLAMMGLMIMGQGFDSETTSLFVLPLVVFFIITQLSGTASLMADRSAKLFDLDSRPLLIIWPVKSTIRWEYIVIGALFSPVVFIFMFLFAYEARSATELVAGFMTFGAFLAAIFFFFYGEKFRIPKYIIVEDGLVIKGKFLSWATIMDVQWRKEHRKNEAVYKLVLRNGLGMPVTSGIPVSGKQQSLVAPLLRKLV